MLLLWAIFTFWQYELVPFLRTNDKIRKHHLVFSIFWDINRRGYIYKLMLTLSYKKDVLGRKKSCIIIKKIALSIKHQKE